MNIKNRILSEIIVPVLLLVLVGCTMTMGPMGVKPGGIPRMNFNKPFSVVYKIDYDAEFFPYLTIYYNVPFSGITFLKEDSLYIATFRLNVNITYEGETILNKGITEVLELKDYSKTVSRDESFFGTFKENISTGKNEVSLMLIDKNSDRRYVWKREILVPEVSDISR